MAHHSVPGVSIPVINDHEIAWAQGYGVRGGGGSAPVTPETLFHAGSIAKSLSAAVALHLVWAYSQRGQGVVIKGNSTGGQGMLLFEILLGLTVEYDWPLS